MGPSSIVEHIGLPDEKKTIIPASYSFLKLDFDGIIRKKKWILNLRFALKNNR